MKETANRIAAKKVEVKEKPQTLAAIDTKYKNKLAKSLESVKEKSLKKSIVASRTSKLTEKRSKVSSKKSELNEDETMQIDSHRIFDNKDTLPIPPLIDL